MGHDILVDGYNVIKNNLMFQMLVSKNIAEARRQLITHLKNRYRNTMYRVVVVFDGNDKKEQTQHEDHICIIYSRHGETADSVIARLAGEAKRKGHGISLYSNDGEVRQSVIEQGGTAHTTQHLTKSFVAPPQDIATRAQHRLAMRRMYGIDPARKAVDEDENLSAPHPGKKKNKSGRYKSHRSRY